MNKTEKIVLDRFKALLSERIGLHRLILFGSRARGDADPDSDLDVLVVLDSQPTDSGRDLISDCAWEAGFEHGIVVVPIVEVGRQWWTPNILCCESFFIKQSFESGGRQEPQPGLFPLPVIENFNVFCNVLYCLFPGCITTMVDLLVFKYPPKTFHGGVIVAIPFSSLLDAHIPNRSSNEEYS